MSYRNQGFSTALIIIVVLFLLAAGAGILLFRQKQESSPVSNTLSSPQATSSDSSTVGEDETKAENQGSSEVPQTQTPIPPPTAQNTSPTPPPQTETPPPQTTPPPPENPAPPPAPTLQTYTIEADDYGFYINSQDIPSLTVKSGDTVKITFQVRTDRVYYAGLDFRGCGQNTGSVAPGATTTIQFQALSTCVITSYWPASGVVKDTLQIIVN